MTRRKEEAPASSTDTLAGASPSAPVAGVNGPPSEASPFLTPSQPPVGLWRTADHWYSFSGVGPYPSVTTILGIMSKDALIAWAKRVVAEQAVWHFENLGAVIREQGPDEAIRYLKRAPDAVKNSAAKLGTGVHLLANTLGADETALEGFQIQKEALPYVQAFRAFLGDYGASSIVSSEKAVINFSAAYGGTYDLMLKLPTGFLGADQLWMVDIKTSAKLYPETGLQLAAYGYAEYICLPDDPHLYPLPPIDRYGVLHLRPDTYPEKGYRFVEYQVRDTDYQAFLAARDLWQWRKEGRFKDTTLGAVSGIPGA